MREDTFPDFKRRGLLGGLGAGAAMAAAGAPGIVLAQNGTAAPPTTSEPPPPASAGLAARAVEAVSDPILRISREVWATPELSLAEERSAAIHLRELEAQGFRTVSRGTSGIPTAFISEWSQGTGGPVIGYLPEYDALPGLDNAAEPRPTPGPGATTPARAGHGCGHNMLGRAARARPSR